MSTEDIVSIEDVAILLRAELAKARALADRFKQEAQIHAQEARTANATIAEIYQCVSGATGEPGNWHGAEPVRARIAELEEDSARYRWLRSTTTLVRDPKTGETMDVRNKPDLWDSSIDAAIKQEKGAQG